jgi:hypothetical protein
MIGVEPEDDGRPQAWRWIGGLAAVAVVAAGVGLVIARLWQSDSPGPGSTVPPAQLTSRLLLGEPPGDLELSAAQPAGPRDAPASDDVVVLADPSTVGAVFAEDGATLVSGRFVALYASPLDAADQFNDEPDGESVDIRGMPGTISVEEDDLNVVYWGPDDNDYRYGVAASRFDRADVLELAEGFTVDDGVAVIASDAVADLRLLGEVRTLFLSFQLTIGMSADETSPEITTLLYGDPSDGGVQLSVVPTPEDDPLPMFSFLYSSTTPATVHGQAAVVATGGVEFPEDVSLVAWVEGGQLIVLSGTFAPGELVRAAQSVRAASAEEWAEIERLGPLPGLDNVGG